VLLLLRARTRPQLPLDGQLRVLARPGRQLTVLTASRQAVLLAAPATVASVLPRAGGTVRALPTGTRTTLLGAQ
jgi:hypothetical protein